MKGNAAYTSLHVFSRNVVVSFDEWVIYLIFSHLLLKDNTIPHVECVDLGEMDTFYSRTSDREIDASRICSGYAHQHFRSQPIGHWFELKLDVLWCLQEQVTILNKLCDLSNVAIKSKPLFRLDFWHFSLLCMKSNENPNIVKTFLAISINKWLECNTSEEWWSTINRTNTSQ